jgi:hypothetical protein
MLRKSDEEFRRSGDVLSKSGKGGRRRASGGFYRSVLDG